ncbi:hypothetical protein ACQ3I4_15070 [Zafaria sp. Z1313]|uniref:hypothetical protein n=1 Tax=Zafaria sp. Z1313 TaxID=3423202 RepID=UPI003D302D85
MTSESRQSSTANASPPVDRPSPVDDAVNRLTTWRQLRIGGMSQDELRDSLAQGGLVRVRSGIYLPGAVASELAAWDRDLVAIHAHAMASRGRCVFVLASAARLWGLDVWGAGNEIHVAQSGRAVAQGKGRGLVRHQMDVDPAFIRTVSGLQLTSAARTTADALRLLDTTSAVVLADSALRAGVALDDIAGHLESARGRRGAVRARERLSLADAASESVAEGRLRMMLHSWGYPPPVLQHQVIVAGQRYRLDFAWPEAGLGLEVHGNGKYFMEKPTGDKLLQERKREARLREAGVSVLNVWWEQLGQPELRERIGSHVAPLIRGRRLTG